MLAAVLYLRMYLCILIFWSYSRLFLDVSNKLACVRDKDEPGRMTNLRATVRAAQGVGPRLLCLSHLLAPIMAYARSRTYLQIFA